MWVVRRGSVRQSEIKANSASVAVEVKVELWVGLVVLGRMDMVRQAKFGRLPWVPDTLQPYKLEKNGPNTVQSAKT